MRKKLSFYILILTVFILSGCTQKVEEKKEAGIKEKIEKPVVFEKQEVKEIVPTESSPEDISLPEEGILMVADFDSGRKPNKVGGDFGAWDRDPTDYTQTCVDSFMPLIRLGDEGYSIQLWYDVMSPNPAYNGFWMKLNGLDVSEYNKLVFWVKGDKQEGFTKVFKVELKNTRGEVGKFYITDTTDKWKKIEIPLNRFSGINDFTSLKEFVIVFEDRIATVKEGAIYIDNIYFSK